MSPMFSQGDEFAPAELQLLIDSIPALIHTSLPDGYLDYFNQRWLEYVGVPLEDVQGWKWRASIHPDDVAGIVDKWRACLASGEIFEYEARVRRADGEYRWMVHRKVPVRDGSGKIVKWYGSSIDIEDRKQTEQALRRGEFYLSEGQRLAHTGSWAFNPSGFFDYCSPEFTRRTARSWRRPLKQCWQRSLVVMSRSASSGQTARFGISAALAFLFSTKQFSRASSAL